MRRRMKKVDKNAQVSDTRLVSKHFPLRYVMLMENNSFEAPFTVSARLTKDLSYTKKEEEIFHKAGTLIFVDIDNMIASIEGSHTDIESDEFEVLYQN